MCFSPKYGVSVMRPVVYADFTEASQQARAEELLREQQAILDRVTAEADARDRAANWRRAKGYLAALALAGGLTLALYLVLNITYTVI